VHPREVAIVGVLVLLVLVPWVTVRDILRQPKPAWRAANRLRWVWIAVAVAVPVLGPAWYLRAVRPGIRAAARQGPRPRA
jgi:hypothetical protein